MSEAENTENLLASTFGSRPHLTPVFIPEMGVSTNSAIFEEKMTFAESYIAAVGDVVVNLLGS